MTVSIGVLNASYVSRVNTEDGPEERLTEYYYIAAGDSKGRRWALPDVDFQTEEEAQRFLQTVDFNPDTWNELDPAYGSEAWGPENEYELACFEADCYNEPRPDATRFWR